MSSAGGTGGRRCAVHALSPKIDDLDTLLMDKQVSWRINLSHPISATFVWIM